jgi:Fe-S-cluster-containing dehydrogenase component
VVEKCNFCHSRWQAVQAKAAAAGKRELDPADYVPACVEACPTQAITFGDLNDRKTKVAREAASPQAFRLLAKLGTDPKVYYRSEHEWVRRLGDADISAIEGEVKRG